MALHQFLQQLTESGRVRVTREGDVEAIASVDATLAQLEETVRLEMPLDPPPLDLPSARWAAVALYRACAFLVFREIDAATVRNQLAAPCPTPASPSSCYSADLVLRYLPDVLVLASGVARDDPLVESLRQLARQWPLSSVGVPELARVDASSFLGHPSLRLLYADRILETGDVSRLDDPRARDAVLAALGENIELAPAVAAAASSARTGGAR